MERYRIASISSPVEGIKIFRLQPGKGAIPPFLPGQFAFLHLLGADGSTIVKRPYSIASTPSSPFLEFVIEMRGGDLTGKLDKLGVGDVVGIEAPYGHMAYRGEGKLALVAGGTGVSPFIGMLRHICEKDIQGTFLLFYSTRSRERILFHDELLGMQKRNPGIKVVITLTREEPPGWDGECGRISEDMLKRHAGEPAGFEWRLCGPPEMVKGVRGCLETLGVEAKKMKIEGWG